MSSDGVGPVFASRRHALKTEGLEFVEHARCKQRAIRQKKTLRLMRLKRIKILTNEEPACTSRACLHARFNLLKKIVGLLPASVRFETTR